MCKTYETYILFIISIILNELLGTHSLYLPVLSPPKKNDPSQGEGLSLSNKRPDYRDPRTGYPCKPPGATEAPPVLGVDLENDNEKNLPPCPPPDTAPVIDRAYQNVSVMAGEQIRFDIGFSGSPEPKISYYKSDKRVYESDRIKAEEGLLISDASRAVDRGIYSMVANNSAGVDYVNFEVEVYDIPEPPSPPFTASNITYNSVVLSWLPPKDGGGLPLLYYTVERMEDNDKWIEMTKTRKLAKNIGPLNTGQKYVFRVRAVNKLGQSKPLMMDGNVIPVGPPSRPYDVKVVHDMGMATIEWKAPVSDNGKPITQYMVESKESPNGQWVNCTQTPNGTLKADANNVVIGKSYEFRVIAKNDVGNSQPSQPTALTLIKDKLNGAFLDKSNVKNIDVDKGKPVTVQVPYGGKPEPTINWTLNGKPINGMEDRIKLSKDKNKTILQIDSADRLTEGLYTVSANNSVGRDEAKFIISVNTEPNAPIGPLEVKTKTKKEQLKCKPPESNGGKAITSYVFEKSDKRFNVWKPVSQVSCAQPNDNQCCRTVLPRSGPNDLYRVRAVNSIGASAPLLQLGNGIDPNEYCPKPIDTPIESINTTRDSIQLKWKEVSNEMEIPLVYYVEHYYSDSSEWRFIGNTTIGNIWIATLTCNSVNKFRVSVANMYCQSQPQYAQEIVTKGRPEAPVGPFQTLNITEDQVIISWTAPKHVCGSPVKLYKVEKNEYNCNGWASVGSTPNVRVRVRHLERGKIYRFRVKSVNDFGESVDSLVSDWIAAKDGRPSPPCSRNATYPRTLAGHLEIEWDDFDTDEVYKGFPEQILGHVLPNSQMNGNNVQTNGNQMKDKPKEENRDNKPSGCARKQEFVQVMNVSRDSVQLSWPHLRPGTAESPPIYSIESYNFTTEMWHSIAMSSENQTTIENLKCLSIYKFRVKEHNTQYKVRELESKLITTKSGVPDAPPGPIDVFDITDEKITLSWSPHQKDCGSPVTEYTLEKQKQGSDQWIFIARTPVVENRVKDLVNGQTYRFRMKAFNRFGESKPYVSKWITPSLLLVSNTTATTPVTPTTAPKKEYPHSLNGSVESSEVTKNSFRIYWPKSEKNNYFYKVEKYNQMKDEWELIRTTNETYLEFSVRKCHSSHRFRVKVSNGVCDSEPIESKVITTDPTMPEPPIGPIRVFDIRNDQMVLTWSQPDCDCGSPITGYTVRIQDTVSNDWKVIGHSKASQTRVKGLEMGKNVRYEVRAINSFGESEPITSNWFWSDNADKSKKS